MLSVVVKRFFELLIGCIGASCIFAFYKENACLSGSPLVVKVFDVLLLVLFFIYNGYMIRHIFLQVTDSFDFYLFNTISILILGAVVAICYFLVTSKIYFWLFSITHIFYFVFGEQQLFLTTLLFFAALFISTILSEKYYIRKIN